jgi:hypothetical protein
MKKRKSFRRLKTRAKSFYNNPLGSPELGSPSIFKPSSNLRR